MSRMSLKDRQIHVFDHITLLNTMMATGLHPVDDVLKMIREKERLLDQYDLLSDRIDDEEKKCKEQTTSCTSPGLWG